MANLYKALRWTCQIPRTKQIRWDSNDSKWPPWDWRILQSTPNIPRLRFNQQTLAHLRGLHWVWLHHVGDQSLGFLDRWSRIGVRLQGSSLWQVRQTLNSTAKKENLRRSYGGLQQLGGSSRVVPKRFIYNDSFISIEFLWYYCNIMTVLNSTVYTTTFYIFFHIFSQSHVSNPRSLRFSLGPLVARWTLTTMHPTDRRKSMRSAMWAKRIPLKWRPRSTISTTSSWSLVPTCLQKGGWPSSMNLLRDDDEEGEDEEDEEDEMIGDDRCWSAMIDDDPWWVVVIGGWVGGWWGC